MATKKKKEIAEEASTKLPLTTRLFPKALSILIESAIQQKFQLATFISALPALCTLAPNIRVKYTFDPADSPHALLLNVLLIGEQSGGKSFVRRVVKCILGRLYAHDAILRRLEQENRAERKAAAKNKQAPKELITDVRTVPATVSNAMLNRRADAFVQLYGHPLTIFMFSEELGAIVECNKKNFSNLNVNMRFAYDLGAIGAGQDYLSDNSFSSQSEIIICSLFCTTPSTLYDYMAKRQVEQGNVTRNIYCDLDVQLGDSAPEFKPITSEQQEMIDAVTERMTADTYVDSKNLAPLIDIDMSWLDAPVRKWCKEQSDQAILDGDKARGTFFKRSSVSAFRAATLMYYLYHIDNDLAKSEADKISEDAIRNRVRKIYLFLANYIIDGMIGKFGSIYNDLVRKLDITTTTKAPSLYEKMPGRFTRDQLKEKVLELGLTTPFRTFIYKWKEHKWIAEVEPGVYQKL